MGYHAVVSQRNGDVTATALVGLNSVLLGFDYAGTARERARLLGFAIHRTDLSAGEAWWLSGQIRFKGDPGDFGEDLPSNRAPFQKFHWADYTAKPGHEYEYRIHPVFGRPGVLDVRNPVLLEVQATQNGSRQLGIYFNRGVTAALAYRRRFGDVRPQDVADRAAFRWLSRGLEEALLGFVDAAERGDVLKVAIYEFEHDSIVEALKRARRRGVEVRLVYHARPDDKQTAVNRTHVAELGLAARRVVPRARTEKISHNKFIVHLRDGVPRRLWTGSANFTEAGLYLQTNFGLILSDAPTTAAFDAYFELLFRDLPQDEMRADLAALLDGVAGGFRRGKRLYLAPVSGDEFLEVAVDLIDRATQAVLISCPFGLDRTITDALKANDAQLLEYGLVNTTNRKRLLGMIDRSSKTSWFATPAWLRRYDGRLWDARAYGNHKIHAKSIVVDPWGPRPRLLIGSANFSDESANENDENSLLLEGDERAAAVVAGEFLRMFDHYKFRDYVKRVDADTSERYLAEDGSWTDDYFDPRTGKFQERRVFAQT